MYYTYMVSWLAVVSTACGFDGEHNTVQDGAVWYSAEPSTVEEGSRLLDSPANSPSVCVCTYRSSSIHGVDGPSPFWSTEALNLLLVRGVGWSVVEL